MSLVLIHLTDTHISDGDNIIIERSAMIINACMYHLSRNDIVIITFTGDLVQSGKEQQYVVAKKFLDDIIDGFKQRDISATLVIVPGNHDCDFIDPDTVRDILIQNVEKDTSGEVIPIQVVETLAHPQIEFNSFRDTICPAIEKVNCIYSLMNLTYPIGKVRIVMINSSWISTKNEQAGRLLIPINMLPEMDYNKEGSEELVITIMHHPLGWLHPDNQNLVAQYLRRTTNILLIGHEHRKDGHSEKGRGWNIYIKNGSELQGNNPKESSFSIYKIDYDSTGFAWQNITTVSFIWDSDHNIYHQASCEEEEFCKNESLIQNSCTPNSRTITRINDIGVLVQHFRVEQVKLSDLFCWPELELLDIYGSDKFGKIIYRDKIFEHLVETKNVLIMGESLSGKTTLLKQLFISGMKYGKCCIMCNGEDFTTHVEKNVIKKIEDLFSEQYSADRLDVFRNLSSDSRILLLDDFEKIIYSDDRRAKLIQTLAAVFGHIILTSGTDNSIAIIVAECLSIEASKMVRYKIRNFGSLKRRELIQKWYELGNNSAMPEREIECKIDTAVGIVNNIIGRQSKLMPSKPFYILSILQSISATGSSDISDGRFGYLYEEIVRRSLSDIPDKSASSLNIYFAVLSNIAYRMFSNDAKTISEEQIIECVQTYIKQMSLPDKTISIISDLHKSRILHINGNGYYRFRYSYLFYFFVGRYMSRNIDDKDIKAQIDNMSEKLYIEAYSNIIIFMCYFLNNNGIIDSILIRAYYTFEHILPFDLANPGEMIQRAYDAIEKILAITKVGEENDVNNQRDQDLITHDDHISQSSQENDIDGTDNSLTTDEEKRYQQEVAEINSAFRIIDVLSQIIRSYPGDISGSRKEEIIIEINDLTMRLVQKMIELLTSFEKQLIQMFSNEVKESGDYPQRGEYVQRVKDLFSSFVIMFASAMVDREAIAISNFYLIPAAESAIPHAQSAMSLNLAVLNVKMRTSQEPPVHELIELYKSMREKKQYFASAVLRQFVAAHLRNNHCGNSNRDMLCLAFDLPKVEMLNSIQSS